jgi:hypothetical protein
LAARLPRLFVAVSSGRRLLALAAITLASGAAMLPAIWTMADHGASLTDFESCATVARADEILDGWGDPGKTAMWWQLGLDIPFVIGFGLFFAGACAAVARRAAEASMPRLERAACFAVWLGPIAALADLVQDLSSAMILAGGVEQPWPRLSALAIGLVGPLLAATALFAAAGYLATRGRRPPGAEPDDQPG